MNPNTFSKLKHSHGKFHVASSTEIGFGPVFTYVRELIWTNYSSLESLITVLKSSENSYLLSSKNKYLSEYISSIISY